MHIDHKERKKLLYIFDIATQGIVAEPYALLLMYYDATAPRILVHSLIRSESQKFFQVRSEAFENFTAAG
jgi:hypothetical protein